VKIIQLFYIGFVQDFLNMFFKDIYKPIPLMYNLVLAMLWRHPENVELEKIKVVHYCAAVTSSYLNL
jgi:lipopolysaccharide biosynthesis glycosyltransferase